MADTIYTPYNTDQYYRIFDANGLEWHDVTMVNTETGEIEQLVRDENDQVEIDFRTGEMITATTTIPIPVSMVPRNRNNNA